MFPAEKEGEWEPHKICSKTVTSVAKGNIAANGAHAPDTEMKDVSNTNGDTSLSTDPPAVQPPEDSSTAVYEDDLLSTEGAVYPIREGRIENWSCLFALFTHIYNVLSPSFAYHSPVLVVSQPCWSARDHELLTQFFFENFKIPAFCIMDAALTACYAYGVGTATVVDVGYDKCDVSAVTDFIVNDYGRGVGIRGCGGQGLSQRLLQVLEKQGFNEDMAEQLKRNAICEILPIGTALPQSLHHGERPANPAAAASTGAMDSGFNVKDADGLRPGQLLRGPGIGTDIGEDNGNGDDEDNEGILDVVAIVAKDNAAELLAKREREKAEKAAAKKGGTVDTTRQIRLKNSEKEKASFIYEEILPYDEAANGEGAALSRKRKREIEVGIGRFMAATPADGCGDGIIDTIAAAIHNTILTHPDPSQRSTLWDNLVIMGNGSRIKGNPVRAVEVFVTDNHRLHTCSAFDSSSSIHSFPFYRDHLHIRTPIQFLNTTSDQWHKYTEPRLPPSSHASPCCSWCKPSTRCSYKTYHATIKSPPSSPQHDARYAPSQP
jgi:actin-related protein 9